CGTGTAARVAWLYATGALGLEERYVHESIVGSRFTARVLRETQVGPFPAVVPEIAGRGFLTGFHTFVVEDDDPLRAGFLVR
ncbi:MAG: proline racemase family protein, partial [Thermomicrobiaceae bacterium]|nr:proline racemase family protein [Thermomicrobiaceae bacterium]